MFLVMPVEIFIMVLRGDKGDLVSFEYSSIRPEKAYFEMFDNLIALTKEYPVMEILLYLRQPDEKDQVDALSIPVQIHEGGKQFTERFQQEH
jgi:hypothetical protein